MKEESHIDFGTRKLAHPYRVSLISHAALLIVINQPRLKMSKIIELVDLPSDVSRPLIYFLAHHQSSPDDDITLFVQRILRSIADNKLSEEILNSPNLVRAISNTNLWLDTSFHTLSFLEDNWTIIRRIMTTTKNTFKSKLTQLVVDGLQNYNGEFFGKKLHFAIIGFYYVHFDSELCIETYRNICKKLFESSSVFDVIPPLSNLLSDTTITNDTRDVNALWKFLLLISMTMQKVVDHKKLNENEHTDVENFVKLINKTGPKLYTKFKKLGTFVLNPFLKTLKIDQFDNSIEAKLYNDAEKLLKAIDENDYPVSLVNHILNEYQRNYSRKPKALDQLIKRMSNHSGHKLMALQMIKPLMQIKTKTTGHVISLMTHREEKGFVVTQRGEHRVLKTLLNYNWLNNLKIEDAKGQTVVIEELCQFIENEDCGELNPEEQMQIATFILNAICNKGCFKSDTPLRILNKLDKLDYNLIQQYLRQNGKGAQRQELARLVTKIPHQNNIVNDCIIYLLGHADIDFDAVKVLSSIENFHFIYENHLAQAIHKNLVDMINNNQAEAADYLKMILSSLGYSCVQDCFNIEEDYMTTPVKLGARLISLAFTITNKQVYNKIVDIYCEMIDKEDEQQFMEGLFRHSIVPILLVYNEKPKEIINRYKSSSPWSEYNHKWTKKSVAYQCDPLINEFAFQLTADSKWDMETVLKRMDQNVTSGIITSVDLQKELNHEATLFKLMSITCTGHPKHDRDRRSLSLNEAEYKNYSSEPTKYLLKLGANRLLIIMKVCLFILSVHSNTKFS